MLTLLAWLGLGLLAVAEFVLIGRFITGHWIWEEGGW